MTATDAQVRILMRERSQGKTQEQAAAIDRVVHHSIIIEFGKEIPSLRAEEAARRNKGAFSPSAAGEKVTGQAGQEDESTGISH